MTSAAQQSSPPTAGRPRLRKATKIVVPIALAVGVGMQFVPVKGIGSNPPERYKLEAPPEVEAILHRACFDCHSNETRWPFYARIAPGSWLMARDVNKGRSRLNFSEWGDADEKERNIDKENCWDQVEAGDMPKWFYVPMHWSAHLSEGDKATLKTWLLAHKQGKEAPAAKKEAPEQK